MNKNREFRNINRKRMLNETYGKTVREPITYDNLFNMEGCKVGDTLRIRLPREYNVKPIGKFKMAKSKKAKPTKLRVIPTGIPSVFSYSDISSQHISNMRLDIVRLATINGQFNDTEAKRMLRFIEKGK